MKKISLALTISLLIGCIAPSIAAPVAPPPPPQLRVGGGGAGAGPWILGGFALAALSLIVCAKVVGQRNKREMTHQEAMMAIFLPFSCLVPR